MMYAFFVFFMLIAFVAIFLLLVQVPIMIARNRGISGSELTTIVVLSWCGIFFGITWVVALVLSLMWQPENLVGKGQGDDVAKLEKLHKLKKDGAITQKEFDAEKKKILKN
jgi:hypothetical protein